MKSKCFEQSNYNSRNFPRSNTQTVNRFKLFFAGCIVSIIIFSTLTVTAQPSGGPFGPLLQTYDLPKVEGIIYIVAPNGKTEQQGETLSNPSTIESVIERVKTGDVIVIRGGTYRAGNMVFNQGITIQPYANEQPVLKGTFIASKWENLGNGLWTHKDRFNN